MAKKTNGHTHQSNGENVPAIPIIKPPSLTALTTMPENDGARAFLEEAKGPMNQPAVLPLISIDHLSEQFLLPSGDKIDSIEGYPLHFFETRRWYKDKPQAGVFSPPDCWSADMQVPHASSHNKQSEKCSSCKWAEFGSAGNTKAPACSTRTWLFLLNPHFGVPPVQVLLVPPSSLRSLHNARTGLLPKARAKAGVYQICWCKFGVERGGPIHCVLKPEIVSVCSEPAECKRIAEVRNQFLNYMEAMRARTPVVDVSEAVEDEPIESMAEAR